MKLVMLAPASVVHTQRWAEALHARGVALTLATQHPDPQWQAPDGVRVHTLPHAGNAGYFLNARALKRLLADERADVLNAHYASGYGTTAMLAGHPRTLLSVWGSDVFDFPYEGRLKRWLLERNLRSARRIASTSEVMAAQVRRVAGDATAVDLTPFGVDCERFAPAPRPHDGLVIGTVKTLAPKYGVDVLLHAFSRLRDCSARLVLVGGGPQRDELKALAHQLGIAPRVQFVGPVPHAEVPRWLNGFDIYVAASRLDSESFGVAAVEASACGLPVVVSDAGGLPEVVLDGETGRVVPREDAAALAAALDDLARAPALRERLGAAGRAHVLRRYEWNACVERMLASLQATAGAAA